MRMLLGLCMLLVLHPSAIPYPRTASQGERVRPEDKATHQQLKASQSEDGPQKTQRQKGEPPPPAEPVHTLKTDNGKEKPSRKEEQPQEESRGWLEWYVVGTWVIAIFSALTAWAAAVVPLAALATTNLR